MLGGGGVLGEAWLRALLAGLEAERGWDLRACDGFVGTSAGSIVAAVLAAGHRPESAAGVAEAWEEAAGDAPGPRGGGALRRIARLAGTVAAPAAPLVAAAQPGGAALRAAVLRRGRRGGARSRGCARRSRACPASSTAGSGSRRSTCAAAAGSLFGAPGAPAASVSDAVLASCAVPWVFRPVAIGGREYVDGGFWSAANLDAAPVGEGTEVLCLNPTATPRLSLDRLGAMRAFAGATATAEAAVLRARGARVRIVAPDAGTVAAIGPDLFDPRRRPQVEAAGYAQGRALAA